MKNIDRGALEPSELFVISGRVGSPNLNPQLAGLLFQQIDQQTELVFGKVDGHDRSSLRLGFGVGSVRNRRATCMEVSNSQSNLPDSGKGRTRLSCELARYLTASSRAGTCLCHGVPTNGSRSSTAVSSFGATPPIGPSPRVSSPIPFGRAT